MRVRLMTSSGDMQFGEGSADFVVDSPRLVAQLVLTRLKLWAGQWFLDRSAGVPWLTEVLGTGTAPLYDTVIRTVISATPGVLGIARYSSSVSGRALTVTATVNTVYSRTIGTATVSGVTSSSSGTVNFTLGY